MVLLQTASNYPIGGARGGCMYDSEDEKWSVCTNNFMELTEPLSGLTHVVIGWDEFGGGSPVSSVDPTELLGVQFQFNCGATCDIDVVLADLSFVE